MLFMLLYANHTGATTPMEQLGESNFTPVPGRGGIVRYVRVTVTNYDARKGKIQAACKNSLIFLFDTSLWARVEVSSEGHHSWKFGALKDVSRGDFPSLKPGTQLYILVDGRAVKAWCTVNAVNKLPVRSSKQRR